MREADIMDEEKVLTTNQGVLVSDIRIGEAAGEHGLVLLRDVRFIEKLAHFDRACTCQWVVHARGQELMA
ncbi:MAG: catalase [Methanosarcinales archaeon]|nr:MAG: catalase [Methanosarcinales archaeon]